MAAQMIGRILVDAAGVGLDETAVLAFDPNGSVIALDEALAAFSEVAARQAKVVEVGYFGRLKEEEIAEVMDISLRTGRRDWEFARVWLARELAHPSGGQA